MWHRLGAVVAAVATFGGSWAVGMAVAEPPEPRVVLSDVGSSALTPFEVDDLFPGQTTTHPVLVSLTPTAPDARLAIEIDGLEDLERECNRDERRAGDTTCGELGGELSQQLYLSAVLTRTDNCDELAGAAHVLKPQPLEALAGGDIIALEDELMSSGDSRCLVVTFDLPRAADNLVQSDLARFDLTVHAEQALPDQAVQGRTDDRGNGGVRAAEDRVLPTAGTGVVLVVLLAVASLASGVAVLRLGRARAQGRPRHRHPG